MGLVQSLTPVSEVVNAVPALSKSEVTKIEKHALSLYNQIGTSTVLLAVELRQLQNGGAHLARGYPNFGEYIESTFEGMNRNTAQQLSREGEVLIVLEKEGRIGLKGKGTNLPGMTGVRSLAKIQKTFGDEIMLAVYDAAAITGRKVTADTVLAATKELEVVKPAELQEGSEDAQPIDVETDADDMPVSSDEDEDDYPELRDRLGDLQDTLYSISDALSEGNLKEALQAYDDVFRELEKVKVELVRISFDATDETKEVNP